MLDRLVIDNTYMVVFLMFINLIFRSILKGTFKTEKKKNSITKQFYT